MYRSVLLPLDGSPYGEQALKIAVSLVKRSGGRLELVHVHQPEPDEEWTPVTPFHFEGLQQSEREWSGQNVEREADYLSTHARKFTAELKGNTEYKVLRGEVVTSLEEEIASANPDVIVMATHGHSGFSRAWLGSVTDAIVRDVHKPIVLVRNREAGQSVELRTDNILVPLDGSRLSESVLKHAIDLADDSSRITLLRVVASAIVPDEFVADSQAEQLIRNRIELALEYLDEVAAELRAEGHQVATDVVVANGPATAILSYASAESTDIICMATQAHSGMRRLLLGSVVDKVLRGASVPILLYRP